jgi:hypothetical protein
MITVTRAEFMADASGVLRRTETEGPIGIMGDDGEVRMIVHAPRDTRDECVACGVKDGELERLRERAKQL